MGKEKRKHSEPRPNIFLIILNFTWKVIKGISQGVLWLAGTISINIWHSFTWILKQPYRLLRYIISGRIPEFENARQEEIFWRIKRQYRRKRLFLLNSLGYGAAVIFFLLILGDRYLSWQRAIEVEISSAGYYAGNFYNTLFQGGIFIAIWTLVVIFHFVFNRMGDGEDNALGEALENEYARSEAREQASNRSIPDIARLVDNAPDEYDTDYDEEKPKRNGAKM